MKKLMSLILVFLMMLTCIAAPVWAEGNLREKTFSAVNDILNRTEGEGFHHNSSAPGVKGLEVSGSDVVLRQKEWICYDISDFESGTYNLTLKSGATNDVPISVLVDNKDVLSTITIPKTGSNSVKKEVFMGQITLDGSHSKIKFSNTHASRALYVNSFTLKKVDPILFLSYKTNVSGVGETVPRGADVFTLNMSADVEEKTVSNDSVAIKKNGEALAANVSVDGSAIVIKLKESLDYGTAYEICLDGVEGKNGSELDAPVNEEFVTADNSNILGAASIEITSFTEESGTITVEGVIKSSQGLAIKGRKAYISVKGEESETEIVAEAESAEAGMFTASYTMPEDTLAGKYEIEVTSDYVEEPYKNSILFFSQALDVELAEAFSGLADTSAAESAVDEYGDYLGVDIEEAKNLIADFDKVYEKLLDKTFEKAADAINAFKEAVYYEALVQTEDKDVVTSILDDETKTEFFDEFDKSLWNVLESDGKENVSQKALDLDKTDRKAFFESLNNEIKETLISQFGLEASKISFTSDEIMTGNVAEVIASIDETAKNVSAIRFEIAYTDESAPLFETGELTATVPSGMTYEISVNDNVVVVDVKAENTVTISENILSLKIPASGKSGGTHTPTVTGTIFYRPDAITDENTNLAVDFETVKNPVITVDVVRELTIDPTKPINNIDGDGFFNNLEAPGGNKPGFEVSGSSVIFRALEWGAYDISSLAEGRYEVSINYSSSAATTYNIDVDGTVLLSGASAPTGGGYSNYITTVLGQIDLSGVQKRIKVENSGNGANYLRGIYIKRVDPLKVVEVKSNVGIEGDIIPRGADRLTFTFNNEINADSFKVENVSVKEKGGSVLPINTIATGANIVIDFAKTLSYDTEYVISLADVTDKFSQSASYEKTVKTTDAENDKGEAKIKINTWKVNGSQFVVEGVILASGGNGIEGRNIIMKGKNPSGTSNDEWDNAVSGKDGKFTLEHIFSSEDPAGKYSVELIYEYGKNSYKAGANYFDETLSKQIAEEFSSLPDEAAVFAKLREYGDSLGVNLDDMEMDVNVSFIGQAMTNKEYEKAADVIDDVNRLYALEKVNQAPSDEAVLDLIDSEDALKEIGEIQRDKWETLSAEKQLEIAEELRSEGRIENPYDLISKIDEKINNALKTAYNINTPYIKSNEATVNIGQSAKITLKATEKQENVVNIHIEICYSEDEAKFFEEETALELSKDLKKLSVTKTEEKGKLIYDLSVLQNTLGTVSKTSFRDEIATISFKAAEGTEGTYSPEVDGYITYHADSDKDHQTSAYYVDVPFEMASNPKITVSKSTSGNDYQGGGGRPGGGSYGTSGNGSSSGSSGSTVKPQIPTITDEGLVIAPKFTDLDQALWAKDSIEALAHLGIVSGRGDGSFAPNDNVTRAEFCKMIVEAFGAVNSSATCEFSDVSNDAWYYTYIASAKGAGYVNGKSEKYFAPNDTITREEMAAIAMRAIKAEINRNGEKFVDDESISSYAKDAVYTLKNRGIINGVGDNAFAPKMSVTRAMAAKVIYLLTVA